MSAVSYQGLRDKSKDLIDKFYREKRGSFMQCLVVSLFFIYLLQVPLQFYKANKV